MALNFPNNPDDGDVYEGYTWNDTVGAWQSTLSDFFPTIVSPTIGQKLVFDGTNWVNTYDDIYGKNILYNGAMQVHQRGASATGITGPGYYTADRWATYFEGALGTWTQSVEDDGPAGSGFTKSVKLLCTTADASPASADRLLLAQRFEGQDLQGLKKGTANAESITLSFWVKSNVTGTYIVDLADLINTRQISASYTVAASGTWEKKTITFAGDTAGVLNNNNLSNISLNIWLASGSDFTSGTLNTSWASTVSANRAVGQTNLAAATSNYFQFTGVKLEVGPAATPFEFKPFGQELAECQRYYYRTEPGAVSKILGNGFNQTTTTMTGIAPFPVTMRTSPTALEQSGTANQYMVIHGNLVATTCSAVPTYSAKTSNHIGGFNFTVASGLTAGQGSEGRTDGTNGANAYLAWSAEL
jgi:hypothetical protein